MKSVIFDLYGTLVDIRTDEESPETWEAAAGYFRRFGAEYTPLELKKAYLQAVSEQERGRLALLGGGYPEVQILDVFRQLFLDKKVPASPETAQAAGEFFRRASTRVLRLYPGAAELLDSLRAGGKAVYLLSNAQKIFTLPELERLGIRDKFDQICISSDYGVKKPDPRFYRALLDDRGIDPACAVMVGNDGVCDILGAKAVGLRTFYIRSAISPVNEPTPPADWVLEEMDLHRAREILLQF